MMNRTQIGCRQLVDAMPIGEAEAVHVISCAGIAVTQGIKGACRACGQAEQELKALHRASGDRGDRAVEYVGRSENCEVGKNAVPKREFDGCSIGTAGSPRKFVQMAWEVVSESCCRTTKESSAGGFGTGIATQALREGNQRVESLALAQRG